MSKLIKQYISEVIKSDDYRKTYDHARRVHRDQRRRSGEPYFDHPKAVRNISRKYYPSDRVAQLAALLHDTLEDYEKGGVFKTEKEVLDGISDSILDKQTSDEVIREVKSLTHDKSVDYTSYVLTLSGTSLRVKLTDMLHNLMTSPSEKQKRKYRSALESLLKKYSGPPPSIKKPHMDALMALSSPTSSEAISESIRKVIIESPKGAGLVVVNGQGKFLALKIYGKYDIPKGQMDESDGGHFQAAMREAEEEASLTVFDFKWGTDSFDTPKTRCWLALTEQSPEISRNPDTGKYEHHGWEWVSYEQMVSKCHNHLKGAIEWSQNKIMGDV